MLSTTYYKREYLQRRLTLNTKVMLNLLFRFSSHASKASERPFSNMFVLEQWIYYSFHKSKEKPLTDNVIKCEVFLSAKVIKQLVL